MKNTVVKLKCIDITVDFYGVCRHDGLVVFVKGLIPDEIANVKIIKLKNKIAYGIIDELIEASPYRVKEKCPIAYKCGGCDIEHIDYSYQLILKKKLVENTFKNAKLDVNVLDTVGSDAAYGYRNKIQVPVSNGKIGYYRNHTNEIVEFDKCCISPEVDNTILNDIRSLIKEYSLFSIIRHIVIRNLSSGIMICFVTNRMEIPHIDEIINILTKKYKEISSIMLNFNNKNTNVIFGSVDKVIYKDEYIIDNWNDLSFAVPIRSFYQINSSQMKKLYDLAIKLGKFNKNDNVLDLFCGIGTISLYLSKYVNKVLGIEIVDKSIEYANKNKEMNKISNVEFVCSDANQITKYIDEYNAIVLDPPRKGIDKELVETLLKINVEKIVYISCNQATFARDLKLLSSKYQINDIQPVDMFPQTKHIELITVLNRI